VAPNQSANNLPCRKCGAHDFLHYTSSTTGKVHRYCRPCQVKRRDAHSQRKVANGGSHTRREWLDKLKSYDGCPRCRLRWDEIPPRPNKRYKFAWTKDHIVPLRQGGNDSIINIQPLCYRCNSAKCDGEGERGKRAALRASTLYSANFSQKNGKRSLKNRRRIRQHN
jgi:5-methylcytosine-specific restriction endonuclease McrA